MSDAIQVWWGEWFDAEGWPKDDDEVAEGSTKTTRRKTRLKNYVQQLPDNPPGLTQEVVTELDGMRTAISNSIGGGAPTEERLDQVSADILKLRQRLWEAQSEVEGAEILAGMLLSKLDNYPDPEGALPEEIEELKNKRAAVRDAIGTDGKYSFARTKVADEASTALGVYHRKVELDIQQREEEKRQQILRNEERERQREEFPKIMPAKIPHTNRGHRSAIVSQRDALTEALKVVPDEAPATVEQNKKVADGLEEFKKLIQTVLNEGRLLNERKLLILGERIPFAENPDSADPEQKTSLEELRVAISKATFEKVESSKANVTAESLDEAQQKLAELKKLHGEVSAQALKAKEELTTAFTGVDGGEHLGALGKEFGAGALQKMLPDLGGAKVVGALAKEYSVSELKALMAELGGAKQLGTLLAEGCGGSIAVLKDFQQEFGTAKAVADLVEGPLGGKPKILAGLVKGCGSDVGRLKAVIDGFGDDLTDLTNLVTQGGFTEKVGGTDEDAVKPETLGLIVGSMDPSNPGKLKEFCAALKKEDGEPDFLAYLKKMLVQNGLGAKPECVAQLLSTGSKGDPQKFRQIAMQISGEEVKPQLDILLKEKGGMGDHPEVFGGFIGSLARKWEGEARIILTDMGESGARNLNGLVKDGGFGASGTNIDGTPKYDLGADFLGKFCVDNCGGDRSNILQFVKAYSTKEQHENLKKTLIDGGLGKKPKCLTELITTGFGGNDFGATLTKMQGFSARLSEDPPQHDKLQKMLGVSGGIGDQPEVFGHLVATGCEKKPDSVHALLKEFDEDGLTKLNSLVKDGGFAKNPAKGVKPECLGELMDIGCDKSPAELQKLVKGINDDDRTHLKGMMEEGALGKEPKVLGHMYKTGCQKTPATLHTFCDEFKTAADQKKLGSLIEDGGFNGKKGGSQRPQTLGEVMHEGFGGPGKNPGAQLKKLHGAFKPGDDPGDIDKLQFIMQSFNFGSPTKGLAGKPGKRIKTLMKHFGDDPTKIKTTFSDKIELQSDPLTRIQRTGKSTAPDLSKEDLIANAATFELEAVGPVSNPGSPPRPVSVNVTDMTHFIQRHTRAKQTFTGRNVGDKDTTFYKEGTTPDDVKKFVEEAHKKLVDTNNTFQRGGYQGFKSNGALKDYKKTDTTTVSGMQVRMGCKITRRPNPANDTFSNDQFYPLAQSTLTTINSGDMMGIKAALGIQP